MGITSKPTPPLHFNVFIHHPCLLSLYLIKTRSNQRSRCNHSPLFPLRPTTRVVTMMPSLCQRSQLRRGGGDFLLWLPIICTNKKRNQTILLYYCYSLTDAQRDPHALKSHNISFRKFWSLDIGLLVCGFVGKNQSRALLVVLSIDLSHFVRILVPLLNNLYVLF